MANRLANETSPYLLQHANNPVDWYAWGDEALSRARAENKPILLSVGYSACHWCHVMERESFENPDIAALMNEHFVSIKVDREERPDVDSIYMQAVQSLTGRGGWPMTVFLTPDGRPFHGGTYYPPEDRQGMPGFPRILQALAQAYRERPEDVERAAARITEGLRAGAVAGASVDGANRLTPAVLDEAAQRLAVQFDAEHGGFGGAPKFPAAMTLDYLLRHHARTGNRHSLEMVTFSLNAMARGGIYDQLGGGFHRYTVDGIWLVPHFEKMLYDNALLTRLYLHGFQATGDPFYRQIVEETLGYVRREMTHADGGFFSSQDADSEGEEGKFFVWTVEELAEVLGDDDGALMARVFGAEASGNFEHSNVLHRPVDLAPLAEEIGVSVPELAERVRRARATLFAVRQRRVKPGRDDKVLTAWNGMMLRALAAAAAVLERADLRDASVRCAEFLTQQLVQDGRVLRTWKDGRASLDGYLEDYALLADALLAVYELTFDARWLTQARDIARTMLARFWDGEAGVFYDTAADATPLITRPRDPLDNATPSGTSVATSVLLKLGLLDGAAQPDAVAMRVLGAHAEAMTRFPSAFGEMLAAADLAIGPATELVIVGVRDADDTRALLREAYRRFRPNLLVIGREPYDLDALQRSPLLEGRDQRDGAATAYVCTGTVCGEPATSVGALAVQLDQSE